MNYLGQYIFHTENFSYYMGNNIREEDDIIEYCKAMINTEFYGEDDKNVLIEDEKLTRKRKISYFHAEEAQSTDNTVSFSLGNLLKLLYHVLTQMDAAHIDVDNEEIRQCLCSVAQQRKSRHETLRACFKRMENDFSIFMTHFFQQKSIPCIVEIGESYWGSRQQLRAGKVIADHITRHNPIDPIFGVLLCPSAGLRHSGDECTSTSLDSYQIEENFWWNYDLATKNYHAIMYDAFRYLKEYHNIGPGADYLASHALLHWEPVSEQRTSLLFWRRTLQRIIEEDIPVEKKII